jgi:HlyD family secretion protein
MASNERTRKTIWLAFLLVAAGGIGGGWWYWKRSSDGATQYTTVAVTRGELTQVVSATGQLNPVLKVEVGSQISGRIQKLHADFNSVVKENDLLAEIDPATYAANLLRAEADLASARAAHKLAQLDYDRAAELFQQKLLSQSDFDRAQATLAQAQAAVKIREAAVESAKVDLSRCKIYSPVDGIVISRNVDMGQTVAASLQSPTLFVIANDLSKMQINANVSEADIGGVAPGQDVRFTVDAFPDRLFYGKVRQVRNSPTSVQNVVSYDTVIDVENRDLKLKPGMTANVSIVIAHRASALKVPNAALRYRPLDPPATNTQTAWTKPSSATMSNAAGVVQRGKAGGGSGGAWRNDRQPTRTLYVLAADSRTPQPVQVKLGISDGRSTEILEGLNENDLVVTGETKPQAKTRATPTNPFGPPFPRR